MKQQEKSLRNELPTITLNVLLHWWHHERSGNIWYRQQITETNRPTLFLQPWALVFHGLSSERQSWEEGRLLHLVFRFTGSEVQLTASIQLTWNFCCIWYVFCQESLTGTGVRNQPKTKVGPQIPAGINFWRHNVHFYCLRLTSSIPWP